MARHRPDTKAERARESILAAAEDAYEADPDFADRLISIADDLQEALHNHATTKVARKVEARSLPNWRGEDGRIVETP